MRQRQKHFLPAHLQLPDHVLDNRVATAEAMLGTQTLPNPMRCVTLLARRRLVGIEHGVDDWQEWFDLRSSRWSGTPVGRRFLMGQDLLQCQPVKAIVTACLTLAHRSGQNMAANLRPQLHIGVHLGASLPIEKTENNPFSQTRKACTIVRLTIPPPPHPPSTSLLLRRQQR